MNCILNLRVNYHYLGYWMKFVNMEVVSFISVPQNTAKNAESHFTMLFL